MVVFGSSLYRLYQRNSVWTRTSDGDGCVPHRDDSLSFDRHYFFTLSTTTLSGCPACDASKEEFLHAAQTFSVSRVLGRPTVRTTSRASDCLIGPVDLPRTSRCWSAYSVGCRWRSPPDAVAFVPRACVRTKRH